MNKLKHMCMRCITSLSNSLMYGQSVIGDTGVEGEVKPELLETHLRSVR